MFVCACASGCACIELNAIHWFLFVDIIDVYRIGRLFERKENLVRTHAHTLSMQENYAPFAARYPFFSRDLFI